MQHRPQGIGDPFGVNAHDDVSANATGNRRLAQDRTRVAIGISMNHHPARCIGRHTGDSHRAINDILVNGKNGRGKLSSSGRDNHC